MDNDYDLNALLLCKYISNHYDKDDDDDVQQNKFMKL